MVVHAYCRDAYDKYINGNQQAEKVFYLRLPDGNRCEDLSLFRSLTCNKNIILDHYYGVWQTFTVSFSVIINNNIRPSALNTAVQPC